jgi:hypothetical protein
MNKGVISIAVLLVTLFVFANHSARAAEPTAAATQELPLAFRALQGDTSQILSEKQAEEIRGQWLIRIPLQTGVVSYWGRGAGFTLQMRTQSRSYPPYQVTWGLRIGR